MSDVMIFGAGDYGDIAYRCFYDRCNIVGYVDNDESRWGGTMNGVPIYSPDIFKDNKYAIMIANKYRAADIKKQLHDDYGITEVMTFSYDVLGEFLDDDEATPGDELIVNFMGGLGNQMFQYAVYKIFQKRGLNVTADLTSFISPLHKKEEEENIFAMQRTFPSIVMKKCHMSVKKRYLSHELDAAEESGESIVFRQKQLAERAFDCAPVLDKMGKGYVTGWFQTYKFAQIVDDDLRRDFTFAYGEQKLQELSDKIKGGHYVCIHMRRGGYLLPSQRKRYGDGCNPAYYERAMEYIRNCFPDIRFCFFSDEIDWVKQNYDMEDAIYVNSSMFDTYEDWYDMRLMSCCSHNIIANSTFSWWGAYLNPNPDKVVIAPRYWFGDHSRAQDMCPPEWVRM